MNENNDAIKILAQEITHCAKQLIRDAPYDHTEKARVIAYLGANKYQIMINGETYEAVSKDVCNLNDIVFVTVIKNDYSNLLIQSSISRRNESSSWTLETDRIDI